MGNDLGKDVPMIDKVIQKDLMISYTYIDVNNQ